MLMHCPEIKIFPGKTTIILSRENRVKIKIIIIIFSYSIIIRYVYNISTDIIILYAKRYNTESPNKLSYYLYKSEKISCSSFGFWRRSGRTRARAACEAIHPLIFRFIIQR